MEFVIYALGEHWVGRIVDLLCFGGATWLVLVELPTAAMIRTHAHYPPLRNTLKVIVASLFTAALVWTVWKKTDSSPPFVFKTLCKGIVAVKADIVSGHRALPDIADVPDTRKWRDGCADYLSQP
ncbi:hypothetical protein GOB13_15225 [Sinorhizobium meliloti]|uniref:hypothetical protein n=1 Tax=Rhizobium meliloti TaxID=382 RepID=UPI000B49B2ED|nr:hypothetical protein [Sinorhizobium meliloti]ASQ04925.1 hypothetical protein CDO23_13835 [Sinorhizobium meliloti]MDX0009029.1 hypothetical protein [Sinorhizobium meliloti]MDX0064720.1 hypothetical protein [Sinorhizobium meliloti]MDX0082669.1 hypothetical protein [Sinorhizobium meliloti]MDX0226506.1 hypothetical protein [Sinorhizobium meliloti]